MRFMENQMISRVYIFYFLPKINWLFIPGVPYIKPELLLASYISSQNIKTNILVLAS